MNKNWRETGSFFHFFSFSSELVKFVKLFENTYEMRLRIRKSSEFQRFHRVTSSDAAILCMRNVTHALHLRKAFGGKRRSNEIAGTLNAPLCTTID